MGIPFTADYRWGEGKGIAQRHFQTAKREHEDLCDIARVLNNLRVVAVAETDKPSLEKSGTIWTIKIPCKTFTYDDDDNDAADSENDSGSGGLAVEGVIFTPQQVSICVNGQTKTMLILGSAPY